MSEALRSPPSPGGHALAPLQTVATPRGERRPAVFVSYAHADRAFVERLLEDLRAAGHACWIDTTAIKGGDEWTRAITAGIENAYAFISVVSAAANRSRWVQREFLWADRKGRSIFPVLGTGDELPIYMVDRQAIALHPDYSGGIRRLLEALPDPAAAAAVLGAAVRDPAGRRALELAYLDRLRFEELQHADLYTPMAGTARAAPKPKRPGGLPSVVARPEAIDMRQQFEVLRAMQRADPDSVAGAPPEPKRFDNILAAVGAARRAVVLGEPGAGKTTTLWKLASDAVATAEGDPAAPIPLLVRLGRWIDPDEPLESFVARELGDLAVHLDALLAEGRAVLLLDGLNETPAAAREAKAAEVRALLERWPSLVAAVTCRELDYTDKLDLALDRITIRPLDAPRILAFVTRYLTATAPGDTPEAREAAGSVRADDMFWKLAGGAALRGVWSVWEKAGASFEQFWSAPDIPRADPDVYTKTTVAQDTEWNNAVKNPRGLMRLAANPYMLYMLTDVYELLGDVPANRAALFASFVAVLLKREEIPDDEATPLIEALASLAYAMQVRSAAVDDDGGAVTAVPRATALELLAERQIYRAASASLITADDEVRFTHQLLQEYFAARRMADLIHSGKLQASEIWPQERWWERTGWEEAAVLLAGLMTDDCTVALEWVAAANPEVAAQCALRSGAKVPEATLARLRDLWIPRLTDLGRDPAPEARAAVGRALGVLTIDGLPLDNRPGVGVLRDADGRWMPDIDWVTVPAGRFVYQDGEARREIVLPAFDIARHPVTWIQFQAFVDDPDGYVDDRWWVDLDDRPSAPMAAALPIANHPRETVSWYEAVAFCRWLTDRMRESGRIEAAGIVQLPTEEQWEKAARGTDGREYPWGDGYRVGHANINETWERIGPHNLGRTSAVGIYPHGASRCGALDMAGNVWEWCLNEYGKPDRVGVSGNAARVLRGGSWNSDRLSARSAARGRDRPHDRNDNIGFRVCGSSPILRH
ncbi:hypothetical protein DCC79_03775 [bacterium]|nr:TIR domain-containing protein [Chloroflexi bacterium CFX6]RIL11755.1 MAG: hypothetical protein DCC79_03775 [bacterium]